jgi:hypothetical protein
MIARNWAICALVGALAGAQVIPDGLIRQFLTKASRTVAAGV